jgi:hypothetical protein
MKSTKALLCAIWSDFRLRQRPLPQKQFLSHLCPLVALITLGLPVKVKATELRNQLTSSEAQNIAPVSDPFDNYERIQWCLDQYNVAKLAEGEFQINLALILNDGDYLTAASLTWPTIKLSAPQNEVIRIVGNDTTVSFLQLNYNNQYVGPLNPCQAVFVILGDRNNVNNNFIRGGDLPQDYVIPSESQRTKMTGIYFLGDSMQNLCENNNRRFQIVSE